MMKARQNKQKYPGTLPSTHIAFHIQVSLFSTHSSVSPNNEKREEEIPFVVM